jgi:YHS domain-containing protein
MHQDLNTLPTTDGAVDPVCGMVVDPEVAATRGLQSTYEGNTYSFCSRGCKLDFDEDPAQYLDPSYKPSM